MHLRKYLFVTITFVLLAFCNAEAQYLRDKTAIIDTNGFYPNDNDVIRFYNDYEIIPLTFNNIFGIPEIEVEFTNKSFPLYFDFGNSSSITITNELENEITYSVIDKSVSLNPDGSFRSNSLRIVIPSFKVFSKTYVNENSEIVDWKTYSTHPLNGLIGLKYLEGKSFTLDCRNKLLIVSSESISESLNEKHVSIIDLKTFQYHPHGVHFEGKVNDKNSIIYFDTGKSQTAFNRKLFTEDKILTDKSGSFYDGVVEMTFKDITVIINYPRVKNMNRKLDTNLITGVEVGIDLLKYFVLSIDRTVDKNLLIIHK